MPARRTAGVVLAGILASVSPAPASAHGTQTVLLVVERTGTAATKFDLEVIAEPGHERSFIGAIGTRLRSGRPETVAPAGMMTQGAGDGVSISTPVRTPVECGRGCTAWAAHSEHGMGIHYRDDLAPEPLNRFYVVVRAEKPQYTFAGTGWVLRKRAFGFRYLDGDQAGSDYAGANGNRVEVFTATPKLPGGRYGSLAQADPPCSNPVTGLASTGVGEATLEGGVKQARVTCPTSKPRTIAGYATGGTSWWMHGTVAGESQDAVARLLVIDLPRP